MGTVRKAVLFLCLNLQNNNNLTTLKETTYGTEEQAEENYMKYLRLFEEKKRNLMRRKDTTIDFTQYLQEWLQYQNYFQSNTRKVYQYVLGQACHICRKLSCVQSMNCILKQLFKRFLIEEDRIFLEQTLDCHLLSLP